jgi:hypothetical protein
MHTPAPVQNGRAGRSREGTYGAELRLDRLNGSIYGLGVAFRERRKWDFEAIAADCLRALHEAEGELEQLALAADRRAAFDRWFDASRNLLHAVAGHAG